MHFLTAPHCASSPGDSAAKSGKIEIVQVWRFFAAAVVVVAHAFSRIIRVFPSHSGETLLFSIKATRTWGHLGVDFFFVISGFIMIWTNWDHFAVSGSVQNFLVRRIARVVPVYWFATSVGVLLLKFAPSVFSFGQHVDFNWIVSSYLFIPCISPGGGLFSPVIGLGWTLNYEMYFYLVFAVALLCRRNLAIGLLGSLFFFSAILGSVIKFENPILIQNTSWLLMEFVIGISVGALIRTGRRLDKRTISIIFYVSVGMLAATLFVDPVRKNMVGFDFTRFIFWGCPCAGLLYTSILRQRDWIASPLEKIFVKLGNASYSIYIFQIFSLPAIAHLFRWMRIDKALSVDAMTFLLAFISIIIGYAVYSVLEKPMEDAAKNFILRRMRRDSGV